MKHKFSSMGRVAIAVVLALSLSLVMAVPVAADSPAETDVGFVFGAGTGDTAEWSTDGTPPSGIYSVKLTYDGGADMAWVNFTPPEGITLAEFVAAPTTYGFSYLRTVEAGCGPELELRFTDGNGEDGGWVRVTVELGLYHYLESSWEDFPADVWHTMTASNTEMCQYFGEESDGTTSLTGDNNFTLPSLIGLIATDSDLDDEADVGAWEMDIVTVSLGWAETQDAAYVDDVIIDGTTYELEPIFLDAEHYSVGDTVEVTVPNFTANLSSIRINPIEAEEEGDDAAWWQVIVTSTSDSVGIIVDLEETGANTGVFTGLFTTEGTLPVAEDELYVQDGDTISVTYGGDDPLSVDWGTAENTVATTLTASVDDTDPTIDVVSPLDGTTEATGTPTISASYSGGTSGINSLSVEMLVNDVDVTDDATATSSAVTYTPEVDLAEGSHDVTVNVSDNAGNAATESWSFRVASWLVEPVSGVDDLDALDTVGVAVSGAGSGIAITVGRYASNPQPEATPAFDMIEDGFFDVQVIESTATQIVIKFADTAITAESRAHVWDDLEGAWLECSDQGYNSLDEYLWVKVRDTTTPNIAELEGTPFAISGEPAVEEISAYYQGYSGDAEVVETTDLLKAANDWADAVVPSGFTEAISTTQLLALANEWAATE